MSHLLSLSRFTKHALALVVVGCLIGLVSLVVAVPQSQAAGSIQGLHVSGNQILNGSGQAIHLYGVNRSGAEYACQQGWGIWDGPADAASVAAIKSWNVNIVRIPVNEDCWLNINGINPAYSGSTYQQAIIGYVNLLNSYGIAAIIDLQINAPGTQVASGLNPMPDEDHSPAFWQSVANTFKGNNSVLFDLLNEPYPDNVNDSTAAWTCWKNGGTCSGVPYQAAGMQQLVNVVRGTGTTNIIMAGGVEYSGTLSQWLNYRPSDPTGNLVASWHVYDFTNCALTCWNSNIAPVMAQVPVIAGEIGETDCAEGFIDPLMAWLDAHGGNYLGWTWDTWDCKSGPSLITDYNGTPTAFGAGLKKHLAALVGSQPTATLTSTATVTPTKTATPKPTNTQATAPTFVPGSTTTTVDDSVKGTGQNQFNYAGSGWTHCTNCNEPAPAVFYNASQSWDSTVNDTVSLAFTGTKVSYYAVTGPGHGIAAVSIDGGASVNVDLYRTTKTGNVLVWTSPILPSGSHTLHIRVTGTKNASSTGTVITLDRADISTGSTATNTPTKTPVPPTNMPTKTPTTSVVTTVDDSVKGTGQNQFNYVGSGWTHCTNCNEPAPAVFYNASQSWDSTVNDTVSLAFTGTKISYYAVTGPGHGIAAVSIDGGAAINVDLYRTTKTGNVLVWTSPVLASGSHTLHIRVTGTKNASSTGTVITLDRADISN